MACMVSLCMSLARKQAREKQREVTERNRKRKSAEEDRNAQSHVSAVPVDSSSTPRGHELSADDDN